MKFKKGNLPWRAKLNVMEQQTFVKVIFPEELSEYEQVELLQMKFDLLTNILIACKIVPTSNIYDHLHVQKNNDDTIERWLYKHGPFQAQILLEVTTHVMNSGEIIYVFNSPHIFDIQAKLN